MGYWEHTWEFYVFAIVKITQMINLLLIETAEVEKVLPTSLISLIFEPPFPMREPHWLAGTTSLRVTGGLLVAGLLLMELMISCRELRGREGGVVGFHQIKGSSHLSNLSLLVSSVLLPATRKSISGKHF